MTLSMKKHAEPVMATLRNISTGSSNRRIACASTALAVACLLGGCSSIGNSDAKSVYTIAKSTWNDSGTDVTLDEAAAVPFATIGVRVGDSTQMLLILATDAGGQRLWTSSARIAITTRNGHIVQTAGFGHDLGNLQTRSMTTDADGGWAAREDVDLPDLKLFSVPIACQAKQTGNKSIKILGQEIKTLRIDESCRSQDSELAWSFRNKYWIDPDSGTVWRSIQHVNPNLDPIEIVVLRPPASD